MVSYMLGDHYTVIMIVSRKRAYRQCLMPWTNVATCMQYDVIMIVILPLSPCLLLLAVWSPCFH